MTAYPRLDAGLLIAADDPVEGLETLVRRASRQTPLGSQFTINVSDSMELVKLTVGDLVALGYDDLIAEKVSASLLKFDFDPPCESLGLGRLVIGDDTPLLIPATPSTSRMP